MQNKIKRHFSVKISLIILFLISTLFFSNDFSLINIEKTAIITALAIDIDGNNTERYTVTAQIAVPEATDTNTETQHTQLSGTSGTIGGAIKKIGDMTGWYPHLSFCNLIVIGGTLADSINTIKVLDYFSQTLRIQDSAMVVMTEGKASELLSVTTPLDTISSFALQRILFKNPGFDADVAVNDIKDFCLEYYDVAHSSFMPIVKPVEEKNGQQDPNAEDGDKSNNGTSSGGQTESGKDKKSPSETTFSANTTALFLKGKRVGTLPEYSTLIFNVLRQDLTGTTLEIDGVKVGLNAPRNYLLTIIKNKPKLKVVADRNSLNVNVNLDVYCKLSDRNVEYAGSDLTKNAPIPKEILTATENFLKDEIKTLIETEKRTGCDFLKIKQQLYRYNYKFYPQYKDNFLENMKEHITVNVYSQVT